MACWLQQLELGDGEAYNRFADALHVHHAGVGTRGAELVVLRQALTVRLLADGDLSQSEIAVVVGCLVVITERDVAVLRRLFCRDARPDLWEARAA